MSDPHRLPFKDFVPYAPDTPGDQVNIHHCRSGKHNDRLYIRRTEDNGIVAYCHHCGCSGSYIQHGIQQGKVRRKRRSTATSKGGQHDGVLRLPSDFTTDTKEWNIHAKTWVKRYGIHDNELESNNVGYSERLGAVVFPVFGKEGTLDCYQYRPIVREVGESRAAGDKPHTERAYPKYITRFREDAVRGVSVFISLPNWVDNAGSTESPANVVVTEDVLSAIKVSRVPKNVGVAILGSSLKEQQAVKIAKLAPNVTIFFDNDNRQVQENQDKAKKLIEPLVCGKVRIIEADKDPKDHSISELESILND